MFLCSQKSETYTEFENLLDTIKDGCEMGLSLQWVIILIEKTTGNYSI